MKYKGTISNYENGYSTPSNEFLAALAGILGTATDYLLGCTDDPTPNKQEQTCEERLNDPETEVFFKDCLKAPEEKKNS